MRLPVFADVADAAFRISTYVDPSPILRNDDLDQRAGRRVYLKCENLQQTGSFKIRGALNRLMQLDAREKERGVVAFSSGNHAQGIARAGKLLGIPAQIVMPKDTPKVKINGVRRDGGAITFYDRVTENREAIAARLAEGGNRVLVPSYDDPDIISGQGTVALEFFREVEKIGDQLEDLVCCVGGGGLIAGISLGFSELSPSTAIWGAEPVGHDDHFRSLASGERVANEPGVRSICDALLSDRPGEITFEINHTSLSGIKLVTDDDVRCAIGYAAQELKLSVEPGGAAALAALLAGKCKGEGPVGIVLTGGNIEPELLSSCVQLWSLGGSDYT